MEYHNKYLKYKSKYRQIQNKYFFHGSQNKIQKYLEPRPSVIMNNKPVVFATNTKWLALVFIAHSANTDLNIGFIGDIPYIMELYPKAFEKLLNIPGYLYYLNPKYFHSDSKLGMQNHEFISEQKIPILKTEKINNIFESLKKKTSVKLVYFHEMENCIYEILKTK